MREAEFRAWLHGQGYAANTVDSDISRMRRVEAAMADYGLNYRDLDAGFDADHLEGILAALRQSLADLPGTPPPRSLVPRSTNYEERLNTAIRCVENYRTFRAAGTMPQGDAEDGGPLDRSALERLRRNFLAKNPDFRTFAQASSFAAAEDDYKRALIARAAQLMQEYEGDAAALGAALMDLVAGKSGLRSNLLDWRTAKLLADVRTAHPGLLEAQAGMLARAADPIAAVTDFAALFWSLLPGDLASKPYAESRTIPSMLRALVDPEGVLAIRSTPTENAAKMLLGRWLFASQPLSARELTNATGMADQIVQVMRDEWQWGPRDYWDVQGFLWETCQKRLPEEQPSPLPLPSAAPATDRNRAMTDPTNLILYGPPGTGKTYATALEAVQLCDALTPEQAAALYPQTEAGRAALMVRYEHLVGAERIAFVTFHQNYSYEDFVEGLRPSQTDEDGQPLANGFRLAPESGIFQKMAERAQVLHRASAAPYDFNGRRVFKMSLGEVANAEQDYLFDEAIADGFVHMGGDSGIDWSDPQFTSKAAMIDAYVAAHPDEPAPHSNSGGIEFPFQLRNRVRVGDLIVVSKGNLMFRAIGEVTGDYHQVEREGDDYTMRRAVKWLWSNAAGVGHDVIYGKRFSQRTLYEFTPSLLKLDAIEALIGDGTNGSPQPAPSKQFVLIIDEINRANISKVFGELITLIEPDKRLGATNALTLTLPYSKKSFGVPANLHIVGTMNTADRSIALLDTALRRRFRFREMAPDPALLPETVDGVPLRHVLEAINDRVEYLAGREHRIGHAFFMGCQNRAAIDAAMRDKVIPLLQEYFFEDWSRVHAVLGSGFIGKRTLAPPPGFPGEKIDSWFVQAAFTADAYDRLVGKAPGTASPTDGEQPGA